MESLINETFMSLGVVGVIGGICFKNIIDRLNKSDDRFDQQEATHRTEMKEITDMYREELRKDRETYTSSIDVLASELRVGMNTLSNEIKEVQGDVRMIKEKVGE